MAYLLRRWLSPLLVALLLSLCLHAHAGTFVDDDGDWDDSGDPSTAWSHSTPLNVTAGDLIVVGYNVTTAADQSPEPTDTQSNDYTIIVSDRDAGEEYGGKLWWARAASTGTVTVTIPYSTGNTASKLYVTSVSGILASGDPVAGSAADAANFTSTATDGVSSGSFTPSENNCYIVEVFLPSSNPTVSVGTGWTARFASDRIYGGSRQQTTATSVAGTFTIGSSTIGVAMAVALKQAAAGGTGIILKRRKH